MPFESRLLAAILEQSPHGIIISDPQGRLTHNAAATRIWAGSAPTTEIGDWVSYRGFHPDGRPYVADDWAMARALRDGVVRPPRETMIERFDGSIGWVLGSAAPIVGPNGERMGAVSVFADITELKQTQAERQRLDARYLQILDAVQEQVTVHAASGRLTYANKAARAFVGAQLELGLGDDQRAVLTSGAPVETLDDVKRGLDGVLRSFHTVHTPLFEGSPQATEVVSVSRDVTDRKRVEADRFFMLEIGEVLSTSLEYELTLRNVARLAVPRLADWCAVDMLDAGGRLVRIAVEHSQRDKVTLAERLHRDYPPDPTQPHGVWNVIRTGKSELVESLPTGFEDAVEPAELRALLKELRFSSYIIAPLRERDRVLGALTLVHAESQRRFTTSDLRFVEDMARRAAIHVSNAQLFHEAKSLIKDLERTNRELDQFAYVASHDLKAPLRGISRLSQWLEEDAGPALSEEARGQLRLLRGRVGRLEGLIQGVLDYARAGRSDAKPEAVELSTLVREVVELLGTSAVTWDEGLPTVRCAKVPLQQVLLNLIGNALKHAETQAPKVVVGALDRGDFVEVWVRDNGPGIEPTFHERIFEIFQTLRPRDELENTGIGLAIVRKIVDGRGGRVWVESSVGQGATFRFTWPRAELSGS